MGAAADSTPVEPASLPARRYVRPPKASPRPTEKGVTSQEAVEFAISYAKEQRLKQEQEQRSITPRTARERQLLGPEADKHYHLVTRSQPGQLAIGTFHAFAMYTADSCTHVGAQPSFCLQTTHMQIWNQ